VDPHASTAGQVLLNRFVRDSHYARHLKKVRAEYARRRDPVLALARVRGAA
jgi:DNA-binding transcriptional MocR family regulator